MHDMHDMHADSPAGRADASLPAAGSCTCTQVRGLARRLTGMYDAALAQHRLTITQYAALITLARAAQPLAIGALAQRLQMDRSTTTRLLAPLERDGLVAPPAAAHARRGERADHRARLLRLTPRGDRRLREAVPAWRAAQQQVDALLGARLATSLTRATRAAAQALTVDQPPAIQPGAARRRDAEASR